MESCSTQPFPATRRMKISLSESKYLTRRSAMLPLKIYKCSHSTCNALSSLSNRGAVLPEDEFPGGGPSALAEFFGDFMLVNGKIWPKTDVEPCEYRLRLLNGCDSRYLVIQFMIVDAGATSFENAVGLDYTIVGSDGGLGDPTKMTGPLVFEPGSRYVNSIILSLCLLAGRISYLTVWTNSFIQGTILLSTFLLPKGKE